MAHVPPAANSGISANTPSCSFELLQGSRWFLILIEIFIFITLLLWASSRAMQNNGFFFHSTALQIFADSGVTVGLSDGGGVGAGSGEPRWI